MEQGGKGRTELMAAFVHTLEQLSDVIEQLAEAEEAKAEAASAGEHKKMDVFLKQEQALLLKLRGLERQRCRQGEDLGWKDMTFHEILTDADEGDSSALSPLFYKLERLLKKLSEAQESANRIINVRLREFEHILGIKDADSAALSRLPSRFHDRYV